MAKNKDLLHSRACPWWLLPTFDNPLRRLLQDPARILAGLVRPGDRAADIGCGMGYFTIPLARFVGRTGLVIAADLQARMLEGLRRRAARAGVLEWIELHQTSATRLDIDPPLDFALAFWMIHETPDPAALLAEIYAVLNPGAALLAVEPRGHVSSGAFEATIAAARKTGFIAEPGPLVFISRSSLLRKP